MNKWGALAAALLTFAVGTHAQDRVPPLPETPQSAGKVFRTTASMVALNVTVMDGRKLVTGLHAGDFEVYEDGVQQQVRLFESTDVPLDLILILDASSSMRDRMPVVHDAARGFMRILREGDRGAVVTFADNVRVVQDLTADREALEAAIGSTVAKGSTALNNAIYISLKQFGRRARDTGEVRRQAIAVLSDGEDTSSIVTFDDVVGLARKMGVSIYTIGLQSELDSLRERTGIVQFSSAAYGLKMLARETGARAFFPSNVYELKNVYGDIAEELEAQYSIAYSPSNARSDGRFRRILVRVPNNPSFHPRTRTGYTADRARGNAVMSPGGLR